MEVIDISKFDFSSLRGRIAEKGFTMTELAERMGISRQSFYSRLAGEIPFKDYEIYNLAKILEIEPENVDDYFFTLKVNRTLTKEDKRMRTWTRNGYKVVEVEFDYDLRQFEVISDNGEIIATITPADLDNQDEIVKALDAGEDVDGWEDGMGNTITI